MLVLYPIIMIQNKRVPYHEKKNDFPNVSIPYVFLLLPYGKNKYIYMKLHIPMARLHYL